MRRFSAAPVHSGWSGCLGLAATLACALIGTAFPGLGAAPVANAPAHWWKGNLHTHSLWSDGDDFPEIVIDWYKQHGYHFLALSDHNTLQQRQAWVLIGTPKLEETVRRYVERFGSQWVEQKITEDYHKVRLKTLPEFRRLFEEPGRFLLIQSEEITDAFGNDEGRIPVHVNATHVRQLIKPAGGSSVLDVLQRNINSVLAQRRATGQPMIPHIAHPNFGWALTAEDLMKVQGERFFEVYNGHPSVHNEGNAQHPGTDRLWDIALAFRLGLLRLGPLFGLAVDDAHQYYRAAPTNANPGRGWIVVRAPRLTPDALIRALEAGDFYASTGVRLRDVQRGPQQLKVSIEAEPGVSYLTLFIGTRRGFDAFSDAAAPAAGERHPASRRYSPEIGAVLAEVRGPEASYTLQGDELYVRAKVISSKAKPNGVSASEREAAWVQPLLPPR